MSQPVFPNPFKPGAGHMPPYLAGREQEKEEFKQLLKQTIVLENMILTGLRGTGKTVLMDTFKPLAFEEKWRWVGTDLSESTSLTEETMAIRLLTDISIITSNITIKKEKVTKIGFISSEDIIEKKLGYEQLIKVYDSIPGLVSDKLKTTLEFVWDCIKGDNSKGVIFAYDEAQTISNHPKKGIYSLSLLLDVFQSLQKRNIPFMLALSGLPTLFPKLVDARTFAERMFKIIVLDRLNKQDSRDAILKPIEDANSPVRFNNKGIEFITEKSGGYPYFIQFICKETYDLYLQHITSNKNSSIPIDEIIRKLDRDFFAGRWSKVTDRQRDLLTVIAQLENCDGEFTVQEITELSKRNNLSNPFSSSQINQLLGVLINSGLIYKNRHGKYSFAVPLLGQYILRQLKEKLV